MTKRKVYLQEQTKKIIIETKGKKHRKIVVFPLSGLLFVNNSKAVTYVYAILISSLWGSERMHVDRLNKQSNSLQVL